MIDPRWNAALEAQTIYRVHQIGQSNLCRPSLGGALNVIFSSCEKMVKLQPDPEDETPRPSFDQAVTS